MVHHTLSGKKYSIKNVVLQRSAYSTILNWLHSNAVISVVFTQQKELMRLKHVTTILMTRLPIMRLVVQHMCTVCGIWRPWRKTCNRNSPRNENKRADEILSEELDADCERAFFAQKQVSKSAPISTHGWRCGRKLPSPRVQQTWICTCNSAEFSDNNNL